MRVHSTVCAPHPTNEGFSDLTRRIQTAIADSGIQSGRVSVFALEAGSAVFLNENESGLRADLDRVFARLAGGPLAGSASVVVPVTEGRPWLGDWQRVMAYVRDEKSGEFVIQIAGA